MKARKWNPKTKEYHDYELPKNASVGFLSNNMDKEIACARCGRKMHFGDGYTSRQIHISDGPGYAICGKCYGKEWQEERENE